MPFLLNPLPCVSRKGETTTIKKHTDSKKWAPSLTVTENSSVIYGLGVRHASVLKWLFSPLCCPWVGKKLENHRLLWENSPPVSHIYFNTVSSEGAQGVDAWLCTMHYVGLLACLWALASSPPPEPYNTCVWNLGINFPSCQTLLPLAQGLHTQGWA